MFQRPTNNVVPLEQRRKNAEFGGHVPASPSTVAMFHSAHNQQFANSTFSVAGGDVVHNHNVHYHYERPRDIWGILQLIPNFRKIYQDMMSKATPGTGMWLVEGDKFRIWLEPNGDTKIFWGSGIPGAGKTLLASIVIKHLEALFAGPDSNICICYVYFRYSDHSEMTVRAILEILVMQTLERHPGCQAAIEQTYARHLRERTEPTEEQLLALLGELAEYMACTFYILDALDEAPTKVQLAVVKALASLNVKLFITSRPLRNVEAKIPDAQTFIIVAQDTDIDLHIAKVINESADLQDLLEQAGPLLREEIVSTIKRNCGGMFLHASLQLDALRECVNAHQVRLRLRDFPSRIEHIYLQTWDRILKQNVDLVSLAKDVLVWILNASRSMTVEELGRAVATSPDTHRFEPDRFVPGTTLMSLCRGLISLEEESKIVRLVHYTAKDTLTNLLHESFPHPHSHLSAVCMSRLTECGFQDTRIRSEEEFKAALNQDPLLRYASEAWAFHAGKILNANDNRHRIAQFVSESKAFPAFTSLDRTWYFDILTPIHIVALYRLPLALIGATIKCNPNIRTALHRQSPLMVGSQSGHEDLVAHIIALSLIEANVVDTGGRSALILAAEQGHEGIVKHLLAHPEIQVNLVDIYRRSALALAAYWGHEGVVKLLLAHPKIHANPINNDELSALVLAASRGYEGVVKLLLAHPAIHVNPVSSYGRSALMQAADRGYEGVVKLLLASPKIQVNLINENGESALMRAALRGHEGVVKLLLAHPEVEVNLVNNDGLSALMQAADRGHEGVARLLLGHPETLVDLINKDGLSALMSAVVEGYEGIVKLLLVHPAIQVNLVTHGRSALLQAAEKGHEGVVKLLLAQPEIQVNLIDNYGLSALMQAAARGHEDAVRLLLADPATQVNLVDEDGPGWSALMLSANEGYEGVVKLLLAHPEIQVNLITNNGWPALMFAAMKGYEGIVKLLLGHPEIQVNLFDDDGWSALMWAAREGRKGVVKLLLAYPGIQVNLVHNDRSFALMEAASQGHEGIVKLLLAHPEVKVNQVDSGGYSALMRAAQYGHRGVVKHLLADPDIQVNQADNHGSAALLLAAHYGHTGVVELLLTTGSLEVNAFDNDGDTAIKMAAERGHKAIVRLLLDIPNVNITARSTTDGYTAMSAARVNGHSAIVELLQEFESCNGMVASPPGVSQLSMFNEVGSESDSEEVYYDADEGSEDDVGLSSDL